MYSFQFSAISYFHFALFKIFVLPIFESCFIPIRLTTLRYSYFLDCFHNAHFIKDLKENVLFLKSPF